MEASGSCILAAHNGAVAIKEVTETGDPFYTDLSCVRIQRHKDKTAFHWYGAFRLPAEYGGGEITVRFHQNADDHLRGLNRTEILRPIPEGSDDYGRLHVLRPDAESHQPRNRGHPPPEACLSQGLASGDGRPAGLRSTGERDDPGPVQGEGSDPAAA